MSAIVRRILCMNAMYAMSAIQLGHAIGKNKLVKSMCDLCMFSYIMAFVFIFDI